MAELITIARPYAKAAFDVARDAGKLAEWSAALARLAVVVSHDEVKTLLSSPRHTADAVAEFVSGLGGDELGSDGQSFVRLLASNHRLAALPDIAGLFETMKTMAENAIDVELTSVVPVSEQYQQQLSTALRERLGRDVRLHCKLDETLLGGAVIRAGDLVIDGSVRSGLNKLASSLAGG